MILFVVAVAVLLSIVFALLRAFLGPTVFDRILAVNSFGTKTVLLIALLAAASGRGDYLDLALLYALLNFIGTVALLRYTEQAPRRQEES
ncbi:MAG: monovalent cation/H+ antiporter complex subunit F [Steroidobacteraceae bacterium]